VFVKLVGRNGLDIKPVIDKYGQILIDECNHLPASNYETLIKSVDTKFIHGLTATPKRQDGLEKLMYFQLGPALYTATTTTTYFPQECEPVVILATENMLDKVLICLIWIHCL
jgi:superfamily II DNA or RNA helicase